LSQRIWWYRDRASHARLGYFSFLLFFLGFGFDFDFGFGFGFGSVIHNAPFVLEID